MGPLKNQNPKVFIFHIKWRKKTEGSQLIDFPVKMASTYR